MTKSLMDCAYSKIIYTEKLDNKIKCYHSASLPHRSVVIAEVVLSQ